MLESATHDSTGACWVDGLLQSPGTASGISPLDHAIVVGDGVFETMKVVGGTDGGFCDACFTGNYPVPVQLELSKLALEKPGPAAD